MKAILGTACLIALLLAAGIALAEDVGKENDEGRSEDGLKIGGYLLSSLGQQRYNPDTIFSPEGSTSHVSLTSRKMQTVLKLNLPQVFSGVFDAQYDQRPYSQDIGRVNQFNLAFDINESLKVRVGKQRVLWGRGFVYIPTDLINPPLDPSGLDLAKIGVPGVSFDYVESGYALTTLLRRENSGLDSAGVKFSPNWKSGLDLDFVYYHAPSINNAVGASFALDADQLLSPSLNGLVVYGGFAQHRRSRYPELLNAEYSANGVTVSYPKVGAQGKPGKYNSLMLGASYQADESLLILGEIYHIGDALSKQQFGSLMSALGDKGSLRQELASPWLNQLSFGRSQRNYASISFNKGTLTEGGSRFTDTFGIEFSSLRSLGDQSGMNAFTFTSDYWGRTEISFRTLFPYGRTNTEFGGSPYKWYSELGLKIGF